MTNISIHIKNNDPLAQKWWQQPILGEQGLLDTLLHSNPKQTIDEKVQWLHEKDMMNIGLLAKTAKSIDKDKFANPEFLEFVRIKYRIAKGIEGYDNLDQSIQMLQVAIEAKDSFIAIDQTELRYRCSKQQAFYQYVEEELKKLDQISVFRESVTERLEEVLPYIKTKEGQTSLQGYANHLYHLSEHKLGLMLLAQFKMYQLSDYSVLRMVSELIQGLKTSDLLDFKSLIRLVKQHFTIFEQLRRIIKVSPAQHNPETYARIIQYIALAYRHSLSYMMFDQLLKILKKWSKAYIIIMGVRDIYPKNQYKLPQSFTDPIPGLDIYRKYTKSLTNSQTKQVYLDLD
ncbi:MAG: hypothetical protein AB4041_05455 [Microcystaceae cyanobacterium]